MSSQDPAIGRQIQEYRITALLGEGGMGKVYLAQQERIGKKIAIKSLKASISSNHTALARFFREAESVNKIQHENVVDIFNLVHDPKENEFFILMEYIDGRTLGGAIREEAPFPARTIGHIGLQICSALAAAHPLGIIHRDLKSYNIILTTRAGQKNFVKILDFGLAGLLDPSSIDQPSLPHLTVKGVPMGSPAYMSPEHVLGAQIDARSDIYSFGVILYEMATGARPFVADNIKELFSKQLSTVPTPPRQRNPNIAPGLEAVILCCLEKKKQDRYPSVVHLAEALAEASGLELGHYWGHAMVSVRGSPPGTELPPFAKRPPAEEDNDDYESMLDTGKNETIKLASSELSVLSLDEISTLPQPDKTIKLNTSLLDNTVDAPTEDKE